MEKKVIGRPKKLNGNINDIRNRVEKQEKNRNWYYERGYLINKIKNLINKYHIDVVDCDFALNYSSKNKEELEGIIKELTMWIISNCNTVFLPSIPQPRTRD
jgi:hypothetical protein